MPGKRVRDPAQGPSPDAGASSPSPFEPPSGTAIQVHPFPLAQALPPVRNVPGSGRQNQSHPEKARLEHPSRHVRRFGTIQRRQPCAVPIRRKIAFTLPVFYLPASKFRHLPRHVPPSAMMTPRASTAVPTGCARRRGAAFSAHCGERYPSTFEQVAVDCTPAPADAPRDHRRFRARQTKEKGLKEPPSRSRNPYRSRMSPSYILARNRYLPSQRPMSVLIPGRGLNHLLLAPSGFRPDRGRPPLESDRPRLQIASARQPAHARSSEKYLASNIMASRS